MNGEGILTWLDGRKYEGQFQLDQKHGIGIFISAGNTKYQGYWKNNKQNGPGKITKPYSENT